MCGTGADGAAPVSWHAMFQETAPSGEAPFRDFAIALFIGALVGIDRERKKTQSQDLEIGGLRTFILIAEAGAIAAWLSRRFDTPWIFVGISFFVAAMAVAGYLQKVKARPQSIGVTTEAAALVVYLLGGATLFGHQQLAVALAIATSAVLAYKQPLHGIVDRLGEDDLRAGIRLLIATFIVLPVLPNKTVDPWDCINPYKMWWLVILISGLSFLGYGISRWLGTGRGALLTGLIGGLASSTAVSLSFAKQSKEPAWAGSPDSLASGILVAWSVMFVRIPIIAAIAYPPLLPGLAAPAAAGCLASLALGILYFRRGALAKKGAAAGVPLKNPFSLTSALKFALVFGVILLLVKWAGQSFSGRGIYVVSALGGSADPDAIALSMGPFVSEGGALRTAVAAIVIAMLANNVTKCGFAVAFGSAALRSRIVVSMLAIAGAALVALFVAGGSAAGGG
jgi:uncharacterized membrane protein (DUF4010 family)